MGGMGKRFLDAGYNCPKYMIEAHGKTLFSWSMVSLRSFTEAGANFIFVVRAADKAEQFIKAECRLIGIKNPQIFEIDELTDGQATTALIGGQKVARPDIPFLVYNIDTFVSPYSLPITAVRGDGWVPCFPGKGDAWSFAVAEKDGRITDIREKVRISPHATIGLYWFSSFNLYNDLYVSYYSDVSRMEKGEKYIAPMYRQMIEQGQPVYLHEVDFNAVIPLGTPAEVQTFLGKSPPVV